MCLFLSVLRSTPRAHFIAETETMKISISHNKLGHCAARNRLVICLPSTLLVVQIDRSGEWQVLRTISTFQSATQPMVRLKRYSLCWRLAPWMSSEPCKAITGANKLLREWSDSSGDWCRSWCESRLLLTKLLLSRRLVMHKEWVILFEHHKLPSGFWQLFIPPVCFGQTTKPSYLCPCSGLEVDVPAPVILAASKPDVKLPPPPQGALPPPSPHVQLCSMGCTHGPSSKGSRTSFAPTWSFLNLVFGSLAYRVKLKLANFYGCSWHSWHLCIFFVCLSPSALVLCIWHRTVRKDTSVRKHLTEDEWKLKVNFKVNFYRKAKVPAQDSSSFQFFFLTEVFRRKQTLATKHFCSCEPRMFWSRRGRGREQKRGNIFFEQLRRQLPPKSLQIIPSNATGLACVSRLQTNLCPSDLPKYPFLPPG